jgi:hypothetical protein
MPILNNATKTFNSATHCKWFFFCSAIIKK